MHPFKYIQYILFCSLISSFSFADLHIETKKKYNRALIFAGGGLRTGLFLGILKAFRDQNLAPDLIIGTCGGAIAAAIAHTIESSEGQLKYIQSEAFYYQFLQKLEWNAPIPRSRKKGIFIFRPLMTLFSFHIRHGMPGVIPDLYNDYLLHLNQDVAHALPLLEDDFAPVHHATIMVAAKLLFKEEDLFNDVEGFKMRGFRKNRTLYRQVVFTDLSTAQAIQGISAPMSSIKTSLVAREIEIMPHVSLAKASATSASDPFFAPPTKIGKDHFTTGAVDMYPVEIAKKLADKVMIVRDMPFRLVEQRGTWAAFGYNFNRDRYRKIFSDLNEVDYDYVVDISRFPQHLRLLPWPRWQTLQVVQQMPTTYEAYRDLAKVHFELGYQWALEAILKKNSPQR